MPPICADLVKKFGEAARRADAAGYDVIEIHGAHGYLLAVPVADQQAQRPVWRRSRRAACRFPLAAARAVQRQLAREKPMFIRVSTVDGAGGWDVEDTIAYAKELGAGRRRHRHLFGRPHRSVHVRRSSVHSASRVPFAAAIKRQADIRTMAVGLILDGPQARGDPAGGRRRPDRDRPAGALRSVLGGACRAGARDATRTSTCGAANTAGGSRNARTNLANAKKTRQQETNMTEVFWRACAHRRRLSLLAGPFGRR